MTTETTNFRAITGVSGDNRGNAIEWSGGGGTPRTMPPKELASMSPHDTADDYVRIPLPRRISPELEMVIESRDLPKVMGRRWRAKMTRGKMYVISMLNADGSPAPRVYLHRFILDLTASDPDVDHINGDGLDNRRSNLRFCDDSQNAANRHQLRTGTSSRYRGVSWNTACGKWEANIKVRYKNHYLGLFVHEDAAARAYDVACRQYFGEFGRPNFESNIEEAA